MNKPVVDTGPGYQPDGQGTEQPQGQEQQAPQAEQAQGDEQQGQETQGNPLTALVQERQGRRDDFTALTGQINQLQQQLGALQQNGAAKPAETKWTNPHDATERPVEYLQAEMQHLQAQVDQATSGFGGRMEQQEQQAALLDFERGALTEISLAASEHPELSSAYSFVNQQFAKAGKATGLKGADLANNVRQNMLTALLNGAQSGTSPAEVVARLAIDWGYGGQQTAKAKGKPPVPPQVAGQEAARQSVGGTAGGGGNTTPPNAQALVSMSRSQLRGNKDALARIKAMAKGEVELG